MSGFFSVVGFNLPVAASPDTKIHYHDLDSDFTHLCYQTLCAGSSANYANPI